MSLRVSLTKPKVKKEDEKGIVTNYYIDAIVPLSKEMRMESFKNMVKVTLSTIAEMYLRNTTLDNFGMVNYIVDNIDFNFQINGMYMYYIQEQLLYGLYRIYIEASRYDSNIMQFDSEAIRQKIGQDLMRYSEIFEAEARNGVI